MQNEINRLTRQLRYLKYSAVCSSLILVALLVSFYKQQQTMFDAISRMMAPVAVTMQAENGEQGCNALQGKKDNSCAVICDQNQKFSAEKKKSL